MHVSFYMNLWPITCSLFSHSYWFLNVLNDTWKRRVILLVVLFIVSYWKEILALPGILVLLGALLYSPSRLTKN